MSGNRYLTVAQFKYSRTCSGFKPFALMHLSSAPIPEFERNEKVKNCLINALKQGDESKALSMWGDFFDEEYGKLPGVINPSAGDLVFAKGERFIKWFFEQNFEIVADGLKYGFLYEDTIIKGETDMLLKRPDGSRLYMEIRFGKNPYSDAARKEENKTPNSVELLARMSTTLYENEDCCIAYLTGKRDKSKEIAEVFESGKGYNLALLRHDTNASERLKQVMSINCKRDCKSCRMSSLCITKPFMETDYVVEKVVKTISTMSKPTEAQEQVICHEDGPMVCTAIPGAGKTRVLVERMFRMIKAGVPAERFFFATFTRKACKEIRDRIGRMVKKGKAPTVGTFHSIAYDIIKESGPEGMFEKIATETVKSRIIEEVVREVPVISGFSYEYPSLGDNGLYKTLIDQFDRINLVGVDAFQYDGDCEGILRAYEAYRRRYESSGYFEYDDLIRYALKLLRDEDILKKYQDRWDYFMVDEFQDVSREQAEFVMLLAGKKNNLLVVGDDDQSIYEWRNGTDYYLRNFSKFYPDAKLIYMEDNFRTTKRILDSAESLIRNNEGRYKKHIKSVKEDGLAPIYAEQFSDEDIIRILEEEKDFEPSDICILGRSNSSLEDLAIKLEAAGLHAVGPRNFVIDSKEFGLLKCFLNFVYNKDEAPGQDLYRILKYCDIDFEHDSTAIKALFFDKAQMPSQISCALAAVDEDTELKEKLCTIFYELTGIEELTAPLEAIMDRFEEEGITELNEALKLMVDMERFHDRAEIEFPRRKGFYNILTSHKAKGKEFPYVIIYGVEAYDDTKEDRNLLYVSMTRAEKKLVMVQRGLQLPPLMDEVKGLQSIDEYMRGLA